MSDFLHSLRNQKDKRFEKKRRPYENPQYRTNDKQGPMDRRKRPMGRPHGEDPMEQLVAKTFPTIKSHLEQILDAQERLLAVEEKNARSQERIAQALENILERFGTAGFSETAEQNADTAAEAPDPAQSYDAQQTVGLIRDLRADGLSFEKIARHLEENGVPTPSGRGRWRGQAISKLILSADNPSIQ